jgi:uncharacterized protein YggE
MASSNSNWYGDLPPEGRRLAQVLALLLMAGLVAGAGAFTYSYLISGQTTAKTAISGRQISVTGEGKVSVRPDVAAFTAGVVTQAKKISDAQKENSERSNAIVNFLTAHGVAERDIKTLAYGISPQYQYFPAPPCTAFPCPPQRPAEIVSYEIRTTIEIKVREIAQTDTLIDGVTSAGANEVGSLSFRVDDEDAARQQARAEAIADAQAKAQKIARSLGVHLVRIAGYYDQTGVPQPMYAGGEGFASISLKAAAAPAIQTGEQDITASVNVSYEFR